MPRLVLHPDRLFPADPATRAIARELYALVAKAPIISPHGHTDPEWFATDAPWANATELLLAPDHYLFRMLYSQGVSLDALAVPRRGGVLPDTDPRAAWRTFAAHWHLFAGTPSAMWLGHVFAEVFGLTETLNEASADHYYDAIGAALASPAFRPRALFERFNIELLATTEGAADDLAHHQAIRASGWQGNVVTTYRPDSVIDPEHDSFARDMARFAELSGEDVTTWSGYLAAHRRRRADFRAMGATATDHGFLTPQTANLSRAECEALFAKVIGGQADAAQAELFRAQMLTEMARMSLEDGMTMQIHPAPRATTTRACLPATGATRARTFPAPPNSSKRCARCSICSATNRRSRSFSSRSTRRPMPANWRRSPGIIRASSSARRGGSTIAPKACAASAR
jgi:glucuronate isomerase